METKILPHRNQNIIPTSYILEIDSSVFKSVQISSIFSRFVQKIKKQLSCCPVWPDILQGNY
jgi:hypothetical protein